MSTKRRKLPSQPMKVEDAGKFKIHFETPADELAFRAAQKILIEYLFAHKDEILARKAKEQEAKEQKKD